MAPHTTHYSLDLNHFFLFFQILDVKPQQHIVVNLYHPQCMVCMMPRAQIAQKEQRNIAKKTGHRRKEQKINQGQLHFRTYQCVPTGG